MKIRYRVITFMICVFLSLPTITFADNILPGKDYFQTVDGTWFDFGTGIGVVNFTGNPIDPANLYGTDTIVERKEEAILPDITSFDTIDIELIGLSLKSIDPVYISGPDSYFDIFVTLDLGSDYIPGTGDETASLGSMTISHEINWPDDGTNSAEGTFDSYFDLYLDALFVPVGMTDPMLIVDIDGLTLTSTDTLWTHTHDGVPSLPDASNFFLAALSGLPDFDLGLVIEEHSGKAGEHRAQNTAAPVPEPATMFLMGSGLVSLLGFRKRRRNG